MALRQFVCPYRWNERFSRWVQLTLHRQRHRMRCLLIRPHELRPVSAGSPSRSLTLASPPHPQCLVPSRPGGSWGGEGWHICTNKPAPNMQMRYLYIRVLYTSHDTYKITFTNGRRDVEYHTCILIEAGVCIVMTYKSSVRINRVRLPILLVVSGTGRMNFSLSPIAPENLASRDRFGRSVPH